MTLGLEATADARATYGALANGAPLAALHAHAALLQAPRGAADIDGLWSLLASGDRLARGLAIRPLSRFAGSDFDRPLSALARDDDLLSREQALWALADRPATQAAVDALRTPGWDAIIATGATDPQALGTLPSGWVVTEHLPQVAALEACDIVVCRGGNNTVTEAITAGLPVLAAPFSTDQFAGAEDLRRAGLGDAIDPATTTADEIAPALNALLAGDAARRAAALGAELRRVPGARIAADDVEIAAAIPAVAA